MDKSFFNDLSILIFGLSVANQVSNAFVLTFPVRRKQLQSPGKLFTGA